MGHVRNYAITDAIATYEKSKGRSVIQPMGWDAFGLPAENAAIQNQQSPSQWTQNNIKSMREQMNAMQFDINWDREVATNDPSYYRWTQWFFIQMMHKGIAYQKAGTVNYDPVEKTVLANEQIDKNGRAWRSGAVVEQREMKQWYFAISQYAEEMIADIDSSGMPNKVKSMQKHWIEHIRDWCVSRQRRWGTPIPVVHCPEHGPVAVPEENLPIQFPADNGDWENYEDKIDHWKHEAHCPICGGKAVRETDTMDTFVDSAWYFFRYIDPQNDSQPFNPEKINQWMPMNVYVGGVEHATAHLVYARFFSRFIRDLGMYAQSEPFSKVIAQGTIQGQTYRDRETNQYVAPENVDPSREYEVTWQKMSKSKFNGVSPQAMFDKYGVDAVRTYIMFKAPIEQDMKWDEGDIKGVVRFVNRIERLQPSNSNDRDEAIASAAKASAERYHQRMQNYKFNTAIAEIMAFSKQVEKAKNSVDKNAAIAQIRRQIAPFSPNFRTF